MKLSLNNRQVKISFLDMEENFLRSAEGIATSGSINIDGTSAIRRTCQLSFATSQISAIDHFELYKTKIKLEVDFGQGFSAQGVYLLTNFSSSWTANNFTFNISGKDKMCLLNGEHGGAFPASINASKIDKYEYIYSLLDKEYEPGKYYYQRPVMKDGEKVEIEYVLDYALFADPDKQYYKRELDIQTTELLIKDIIINLLIEYGKEKKQNIIINDLDIKGLILLDYVGKEDLFMFRDIETGKVESMTINGEDLVDIGKEDWVKVDNNLYYDEENNWTGSHQPIIYYSLSPLGETNGENATQVKLYATGDKIYQVIKVRYGDTFGYRDTDLTYANDLIGAVNENIVTLLDKIKNLLGNFEYFYDVNGHFIFQKRKDYVNNDFSKILVDGLGIEYVSGYPELNVKRLELKDITSISNAPQLLNIKNDFSVWGTRQGESGQLPVHARIGIQNKPRYYKTYDGIEFKVDEVADRTSLLASLNTKNANIDKSIKDQWDYLGAKNADSLFDQGIVTIKDGEQIITSAEDDYNFLRENLIGGSRPDKYDNSIDWALKSFPKVIMMSYQLAGLLSKIYSYFRNGRTWVLNGKKDLWPRYFNFLVEKLANELFVKQNYNGDSIFYPSSNSTSLFSKIIEFFEERSGASLIITEQAGEDTEAELNNFNNLTFFSWQLEENKTDLTIWSYNEKQAFYTGSIDNIPLFYSEEINTNNEDASGADIELNIIRQLIKKAFYLWFIDENSKVQSFNLLKALGDSFSIRLIEYDDGQGYSLNQAITRQIITISTFTEEAKEKASIQKKYYNATEIINESILSKNNEYEDNYYDVRGNLINLHDYREIIYQMAKDYYNNNQKDDFWQVINKNNNNAYLSQTTGYEHYYSDFLGFWRQLYYDPIYEDLTYELPVGYFPTDYDETTGWHKDVNDNPSGLNFWFELIDPVGDYAKYSIDNIGLKGKYSNEQQVKTVAVKKTPAIKVLSPMDWELLPENPNPSYTYIQMNGPLANAYNDSSQGFSALEKIQDLLISHTYFKETLTISIRPNQDLQVNNRVKVEGFDGEYTISKITMPLTYNGLISLTLTKIPPVIGTEIIRKEFE